MLCRHIRGRVGTKQTHYGVLETGRVKMIDQYEAAELFVIGRASDVILGDKTIDFDDNTAEPPPNLRVMTLAMFEE